MKSNAQVSGPRAVTWRLGHAAGAWAWARSEVHMGHRVLKGFVAAQSAANRAVKKAIREGILDGEPSHCTVCARVGTRAEKTSKRLSTPAWTIVWHHWSYLPEHHLDVVAVCRSCHNYIHQGDIPEPLTGELRTGSLIKRQRTPKHRRAA